MQATIEDSSQILECLESVKPLTFVKQRYLHLPDFQLTVKRIKMKELPYYRPEPSVCKGEV